MEDFGIFPKLTKSYILDRVSEAEIMAFYTEIPTTEENFFGNAFCSPFREDKYATCNYYYSPKDQKLRLRDFAGASQGHLDRMYNADIFDVVGFKHKLNPNIAQHFFLILNIIAKDFKLHKYKDDEQEIIKINNFITKQKNVKERLKIIKVAPRKWNKGDEVYWYGNYGISHATLRAGKVYPVQEASIEDKKGFITRTYLYKYNDPCYAYYGGVENGIHIWKLYFPKRNSRIQSKVITNKAFIQGYDLFMPCRIGVITKSYKDVLLLREFGIQAISLSSEAIPLTPDEYFSIKMNCDFLVSVLDYDKTGIKMANYLKKRYNIKPLMLTRGRFGMPDYGVKDLTDFREVYGKDKTKELINQAIESMQEAIDYSKKLNSKIWNMLN